MTEDHKDRMKREHHVWCNFFMRPVRGCRMCRELWKKFPYDNDEWASEHLQGKHFPDVVKKEGS